MSAQLPDIVVVSPDPRGFWHCNFWDRSEYADEDEWRYVSAPPDGFLTTSIGATEESAVASAKQHWPSAAVVVSDGEGES